MTPLSDPSRPQFGSFALVLLILVLLLLIALAFYWRSAWWIETGPPSGTSLQRQAPLEVAAVAAVRLHGRAGRLDARPAAGYRGV